jgi:TRAP-type mannitol/chloroaromatic compound transport system permease small subunit
MQGFLGISRGIDAVNTLIGRWAAWLIVIAVFVSAGNAIVRKVFNVSYTSLLEAQWYLFGGVFMLCAAWTFLCNEHIRVDVVSGHLKKRTRDWIDVFGHVVFFAPFIGVMLYETFPYFINSYNSGEVSNQAGGLIIWPAKGLILLGFILLGLQGISELIKRLAIIGGQLEDASGGGGHHEAAEAEAKRLLNELAAEAEKRT